MLAASELDRSTTAPLARAGRPCHEVAAILFIVERPAPTSANGLLAAAGLRRTPVRLAVLGVLKGAARPLGVAEVLEHLPSDTDAVTVYRTLNTFTRERIVHRVRGEDRTARYALGDAADVAPAATASKRQESARAKPAHGHAHFVCDTCGGVECLEESKIPKTLVSALRVAPRYAVTYPEILLHGTCPNCRT